MTRLRKTSRSDISHSGERSAMKASPAFYCPHCRHEVVVVKAADNVFDDFNHAIVVDGEARHVRRRDWQVLEVLRERQGIPVGPDAFYHRIWELETDDPPFVEQAIKVHV